MEKKIEHHDSPMPSGIGARLKAAREAAGLGLGEVADRLKLSLRQLDAIERDDFDALPGATFVRGFVRNYARFLEVDPEPLMQALEQHFPSAVNEVANLVKGTAARETAHEAEEPEPAPAGGGAGKWLALLVVAAALAGGGAWYANRDADSAAKQAGSADNQLAPMLTQQREASAAQAVAPAADKAASAPVAAAPAPAAQGKPQASAPQAAAKPVAKPVASAAAAVKVAKPAAASAPQAEGSDRVSVNVKDAAWVSVQDANGRRLIYQVMQPGNATEVTGLAPFKVVVGNASQVELNYNGKPVDLSGKIRGTTAKIQLK
ncbi:DUF4115 domain-containing protein [Chromobacterium subtsugae]|uniref:DUF4115 domain-containing protein n=3 Tax=Chromobacterium subtsugae TaxID=251747 RepID=A0ABS7FL29_9NEIS|nr:MULTISPECIES: RodZ domain-containing protein [Chromobacterium]KZE86807.1 hypothetical protein AWB61_13680 [Chromobacterium sp. F49]MBW7569100.1 helix-turn-helix domain-containing protein [Chromobacterium subtsugae]MBW8290170.1 DUF4115 domain-containing protein [Chromobacterium subtsugae]WSE92925.1 helix-turn-helix domain-containing protein [Chromobacterium subtsugae]WVH61303.1 helix-turn-helix domain-containing protein [Chromobacterium subtsugae]